MHPLALRPTSLPHRSAHLVLALVFAVVLAGCGSDGEPVAADPDASASTSTSSDANTTSPSAPTAEAPTTTAPAPPRTFTVAATGDILLHTPVHFAALNYGNGNGYDFTPMFVEVAPILSGADLAICHLETPLSATSTDLSGFPMFNAPAEIAVAVAEAGYDGCSTASNHSLDRGFAGVRQTLDVLDAAGLTHAGMARTAEEAEAPPIYEVTTDDGRAVSVGHLSYTYGLNGIPLPADAPFAANVIDDDAILAAAASLRERGAEVVLVSLQWGNEYQAQPSPEQQRLADVLLGSDDIDAIIGTHVHVVQPIERRGDKVVIYGLGNFLSNQVMRQDTLDGVIVELTFVERDDERFGVGPIRYTPTRVDVGPYIIRPVGPDTDPVSFERTRSALELLGTFDGEATTAG